MRRRRSGCPFSSPDRVAADRAATQSDLQEDPVQDLPLFEGQLDRRELARDRLDGHRTLIGAHERVLDLLRLLRPGLIRLGERQLAHQGRTCAR